MGRLGNACEVFVLLEGKRDGDKMQRERSWTVCPLNVPMMHALENGNTLDDE